MMDYYNQVEKNSNEELPKLGLQQEAPPIKVDWKNVPKLDDLKNDLIAAQPDHDAQCAKVEGYIDAMNITGSHKVKTPDGKSSVQPKLIRKQAEWRYPSLTDPFLSTVDLFNTSPVTASDKKAARQVQLVLNDQFNNKINKLKFINEYVRTGVDEGTIICRVGWKTETTEDTYEAPLYDLQPDPTMEEIYSEMAAVEQSDPALFKETYPLFLINAYEASVQDGTLYRPIKTDTTETVTETRTLHNHPTVDICNVKDVIIDPTCQGDIDSAQFIIYRFETNKSDLLKAGIYENLDYINIPNNQTQMASEIETASSSSFQFKDEARQKIYAYEYWGYRDINGTGVTEPIVITWVGDTVIRMGENPFPDKKPPFVVVQYMPIRKSVYGEPDGTLIVDNQKITGAVTRGMIDIMARSANGQVAHRKDALDPINKMKFDRGEDYEINGGVDPRLAIYSHVYPEIPQSAQYMLNMQGFEAESYTGTKVFGSGLSGQALGDTATGIRGALDAASKRELGLLRNLADGIINIGYKFNAMNAEFLDEDEVVRVTEESFVPIKRDDLSGRVDIKLSISTAEEDNQQAQEIAFQLQTMGNTLPFELTQILLADAARLRKMPDLAKRIEEFTPQPDPLQQRIQELEVIKLEKEIAEIDSRTIKNMAGAGLDEAKTENTEADTDQKNLNYVEQESGVTQARAKENVQTQAESQTVKSIIESNLKDRGN